jgi:hypothetical protein
MNCLDKLLIFAFRVLQPFLLITSLAFGQISVGNDVLYLGDTIVVNKSYSESYDLPIQIKSGDILHNMCDTLYLINGQRKRFYERLRIVFDEKSIVSSDSILQNYQLMLDDCEKNYRALLKNCDSTSNLLADLLNSTESSLKETKNSLNFSQQTLDNVKHSLTEANRLLEEEKNAQLTQKFTYGLIGVAAGVLLAFVVK